MSVLHLNPERIKRLATPDVVHLLGGRKTLGRALAHPEHDPLGWANYLEQGLPLIAVEHAAGLLDGREADTFAALGLHIRTVQRLRQGQSPGRVPFAVACDVLRALGVLEQALRTFETPEAANDWLTRPKAFLGRQTPLARASCPLLGRAITQRLIAIERGLLA